MQKYNRIETVKNKKSTSEVCWNYLAEKDGGLYLTLALFQVKYEFSLVYPRTLFEKRVRGLFNGLIKISNDFDIPTPYPVIQTKRNKGATGAHAYSIF